MVTPKVVKEIIESVSNIKDISIRNRARTLTDLRYVYIKLCYEFIDKPSLTLLGQHIDRKHCDILHLKNKVDDMMLSSKFTAMDVYLACKNHLGSVKHSNGINIIDLKTIFQVKQYYRVRHMRNIEKYHKYINTLIKRIETNKSNSFLKRCQDLTPEDLKELEFKFDVFFRVKNKLQKNDY
jgi:hypothetical protein